MDHRPQGVRTTICSSCREDWTEHVRLAQERAVAFAFARMDEDEGLTSDEESYIRSRAEVTHRECVSLLLRKNTGPAGPQGAQGPMGNPGGAGLNEHHVREIARRVVNESGL